MFSWLRLCPRRKPPQPHVAVPVTPPVAEPVAPTPSWYMTAHDPRIDKTCWAQLSRREFDDYSVYIKAHGFHIPLQFCSLLPASERWNATTLTVQPEARLLSIVLVDQPQEQSVTMSYDESVVEICESH